LMQPYASVRVLAKWTLGVQPGVIA
jgi:hypothetical protein